MEDIIKAQNEEFKQVVKKQDIYLLVSSVLLGLIFDILFFEKKPGISYPLFVIAFYLVFLGNLRHKLSFKFDFGWFLSIPIIALSVTYSIFSNQIFATFNFLIIPFLIIAQTILISGENKYLWFDTRFLKDILYGVFNRVFGNISKPFFVGLSSIRFTKNAEKDSVVKKVLIGLGMSIPLLIIVISLLTSADSIFKQLIDEMLSVFGSIKTSTLPFQGILILLMSVTVFSYTWSFLKSNESKQSRIEQGAAEINKNSWDPVISITILSLINCVYLVFILIQFAYMFSPLNNALPPGFTYAEYARRGFFELLMVTLINFTLLLSSLKFTRKDGKLVARSVRILHSILVLSTIVILSSAYLRMSLYEASYGYTYLRILTHSFMIYLFILFLIALYKIWNERISLLKPYIVITIMAYVILNFANIDVLIAKNNINRYLETGKLDTNYLLNLSYDSIPVLVELLNEENTPIDLKRYLVEQEKKLSQKQDWQSLNLSKYKAKKVLSSE